MVDTFKTFELGLMIQTVATVYILLVIYALQFTMDGRRFAIDYLQLAISDLRLTKICDCLRFAINYELRLAEICD